MILDCKSVKGVIFDIDGTILDSMKIWEKLCSNYLKSIGVIPDDDIDNIVSTMTIRECIAFVKSRYSIKLSDDEMEKGVLGIIGDF